MNLSVFMFIRVYLNNSRPTAESKPPVLQVSDQDLYNFLYRVGARANQSRIIVDLINTWNEFI